jgi:hypothetical protein
MALTKLPKAGIGTGQVDSSKIEDGTVQNLEFEDTTLTSAKFADSTIANAKLSNSSFTINGTAVNLGASITANANVEWQSVVTSNTTMVAGRGYFVNTTSGAITMTLPSSASIGDTISIKDYAETFATNKLTIARNSHKIQGATNNSEIKTNRASVTLVYVDATQGWIYTEEQNIGALGAPQYTAATGGTVTTSGNFKIHEFTSSSNFVVSALGNAPSNPNGGPSNVDYLVVAGGGAGGTGYAGGGGGAGGFRTTFPSPSCNAGAFPISATTYPITVGGGGAQTCGPDGSNGNGGRGSNSTFSTITSTGGGGGRGGSGTGGSSCMPGGSGGGAGNDTTGSPSYGTGNTPPVSPSQGNPGAASGGPDGPDDRNGAGGGGGIAAAGTAGVVNSKGGDGGAGSLNQIDGLDNAGAFFDRSPNGFSISESGDAKNESSVFNINKTSMLFDGSGDKITTAENSAFARGTGDWTLEWFLYKTKTQTSGESIVMQQDTSSGSNGFQVELTSGKVTLYNYELDNNWTIRAQEDSVQAINTWTHYALVRASNVHTLYKNGVAQSTTNTNSGSHNPEYQGLIWGAHRSDSNRYLSGYLDNLRFSSVARYTSNFSTPTANFTADGNTIFLCQSNEHSRYYSGGGQGGARQSPMTGGRGGFGGGGPGSIGTGAGTAGTANLGGGGGGGGKSSLPAVGGVGGSGIVIIRYKYQG